jgi:hypothetical protein
MQKKLAAAELLFPLKFIHKEKSRFFLLVEINVKYQVEIISNLLSRFELMKKILTNSRFLHLFYGSVVASLGLYIYLTNTKENKSLIQTLKIQSNVTERLASRCKRDFFRYTNAYVNVINRKAEHDVADISSNTEKFVNELDSLIVDFEQNVEKKSKFLQKTFIPTRLYFNQEKIDFLQNTIDAAVDSISSKVLDVKYKKVLYEDNKRYDFEKEGFNTLPFDVALVKLRQQIAEIRYLECSTIQYLAGKNGPCVDIVFDDYILAFSTHSSTARVGEPFKANMALCSYGSTSYGPNFKYYVDNEEIKTYDGLVSFTKTYNTSGKKTIRARASIKNPLTGAVKEHYREYSFEVLPK